MKRVDVVMNGWDEYELIDSGEGVKLERFGHILIDRPDPQAVWHKHNSALWDTAHAQFVWGEKGARWKVRHELSVPWNISWNRAVFSLGLKEFKHIGVFPEHKGQWGDIALFCKSKESRVLNLFGYTGAASIVAAQAGGIVTHVDASKQTLLTVRENMKLSGLSEDAIRIVCEDALRYARRLIERGEQFEVIIMDPPAFGRGPKGEVWKIEESLTDLVKLIPKLLSPNNGMVILNGYASGYSARTFGELLEDVLGDRGEITYGDIGIEQKNSGRVLTTGIYAMWRSV